MHTNIMRIKKIPNRQRNKSARSPVNSEQKRKQPRRNKKGIARKTRKVPTPTQTLQLRAAAKTPTSSNRASEARTRALAALGRMRREQISLSKACREEHIKPATFRHYVGSAVRQDRPGGPFHATKGDSLRRDLQIPTEQGLTVIPVYGSKNARFISDYLNAISEYLRTGNRTKLNAFRGKTVKVNGKNVKLITDPAMLLPLAEADVLHFDQLYASATGRG